MPLMRDDTTGILYKKWQCPSPEAVILLVHGLGAHSDRWDFFAGYFLQNNISSYALELKGFGRTEGLKGHIDSFENYFDDIQSLLTIIKRDNGAKKVFLAGESLGALITFLLALKRPELFSGVIGLSPAFKSRLKLTLFERVKIFSSLIFNPKRQFSLPFDSSACTRDLEYRKLMDQNKRECRVATAKLLWNILMAQDRVMSQENRVSIPLLFLIPGASDQLTDPTTVKKVFNALKCADKEIVEYPDMIHALSIDLGRQKVFEDIVKWVKKRT